MYEGRYLLAENTFCHCVFYRIDASSTVHHGGTKETMKYSIITTAFNQLEQLKRALVGWQSQSYGPLGSDFELVIGDDGSADGVIEWCKTNGIPYATQPHQGYRFTVACNIAIAVSKGEYLVFVAGDCVPDKDFLTNIDKVISENKLVTGMRFQVDAEMNILGPDWRMDFAPFPIVEPETKVSTTEPWKLMTLTSMVISRKRFDELGGLFSGYDEGYGKMDWDLAANAYYKGMELVWAPKAFLYHFKHPEREDTENSTTTFYERLRKFQQEATI